MLTGAGGAFVSGTDISQFSGFAEEHDALEYEARMDAWMSALERVRVPTIAALRGPVVGGGAAIAAACDLRIAAPSARFGVPVARTLGNCFSMANVVRLSSLIGVARVKEIVFTARLVDADEALRIGLVNAIADPVLERALATAHELAAKSPVALSLAKRLCNLALGVDHSGGLETEASEFAQLFASEDAKEGLAAFVEKREPSFVGR